MPIQTLSFDFLNFQKCKDEVIFKKFENRIKILSSHNKLGCHHEKSGKKKQECEITQLRVEEGRVISIPKLLSVLTAGKWSGTIYCSQRRQGLYLDWYLFFTATLLLYFCCTLSSVCTIVFLFAKDRKVEVDNLLLAKKTRTVSRAKSAIATTNSWPAGNNNKEDNKENNKEGNKENETFQL